MGYPEDFVDPILACMNASMTWPTITAPGLPNFALATFGASFAPINYLLDFLPPDPLNLPTVPDISICIAPFMAAINLPAAYPPINVTIGGVTINIPGVGSPPYAYDLSGEMKLIATTIALPFIVIKNIILKIISDLVIEIPSAAIIMGIFVSLAIEIGLVGAAVPQFAFCISTALFNLLTALIPV